MIQMQLREPDVRAGALEEIADVQNRMMVQAAPERGAESNGEDQQGRADVAELHVDSFSDEWCR